MFQAGAAFQARDDEIFKNGLTWGELDCQRGELRLSPRYWNPDNYDWPAETGRFPERSRVPGGEGKSMALRQTLAELLERQPDLRVLWRRDDAAGITADQLLALPRGDAPWLVVTDAADLVARRSLFGTGSGGDECWTESMNRRIR